MPSSDLELTPARLGAVLAGAAVSLLAVAAAVYGISVAWHDAPNLGAPAVAGPPAPTTTAGPAAPVTTAAPVSTSTTVVQPADPATYLATVDDCRQNGADLRIFGSITNRGGALTAYRITATATAPDGAVLARGTTDTAPLDAGARADWVVRTTSAVQLPEVGARCDLADVGVLGAA